MNACVLKTKKGFLLCNTYKGKEGLHSKIDHSHKGTIIKSMTSS